MTTAKSPNVPAHCQDRRTSGTAPSAASDVGVVLANSGEMLVASDVAWER